MKRPSADCSHSDSETKRFHGDHSTSDVVMFMSDADVGQCGRTIAKCARQRKWSCGRSAKMEEKGFVDEMRVHDVVSRADAAKKGCRVIHT